MKLIKQLTLYSLILTSGALFAACSDEEDLSPSGADDDFFSVPADATDPTSVLRRDFFNETGIHLLFSEILRTTIVGKNSDGTDITREETIDFRWNFTNYNDYLEYEGEYISDVESQRKVAELFKENVYPHIEGSSLSPFSVLLFGSLKSRTSSWDPMEDTYTLDCWRCLGVNTSGWTESTSQEETDKYTRNICKNLVSARFSTSSKDAQPWMDISDELSRKYLVDILGDDWDRDITKVYELGFFNYDEDWNDRLYRDRLPYASWDFEDYFDALFDMSEEDFVAQYGNYAKIMEKYYLMKELIERTGYKF